MKSVPHWHHMKTARYLALKLSLVGLALTGLMSCADSPEKAEKPPLNVLFILTDDQAPDTVHALGNSRIATPNIDGLAASGMTFTHVFNQGAWSGAVCLPSRQMINTGRHLYHTGLDARGSVNPKYRKRHAVMGETFRQAGYDTFQTGKWHLSMDVWKRSFTHGKAIHEAGMSRHEQGGHWAANFTDYKSDQTGDAAFAHYKGNKHSTEVIGDAAVDFLKDRAKSHKPFMMYVGFLAPHDPRQAPKEYLQRYPVDTISLPANYKAFHPFDQGDYYLRDEVLAGFPRSGKDIKQHISEYYAMIEQTDTQVGRILKALDESGQAENTLIIFTSDHGLAVGKHGLIGKQNQYDHSVRVPFIVKGPSVPANHSVPGMFYLNSIFPTAAEMAGLDIPQSVQAPSIVPLIKGEKSTVFDTIYGSYRHFQRMIRSQDYKLIFYPMINRVQLFDMQADPNELNDISALPQHQSRIATMMTELEGWKQVVGDPLINNAPEESYSDFLNLTWK